MKDKVIVGVAGGEFGIRGFIDAYEPNTGKRAWRFSPQMGTTMHGTSPITYMLGGRQHVLVPAGTTLTAWALPQ